MTPRERLRLSLHIAQVRMARALQAVAGLGAFAGLVLYGLPAFLAGVAAVLVFRMIEPAPDPDLDRLTGRKP